MTWMNVKVKSVDKVAPMIREYTLVAMEGNLIPFSPGSHVTVEMKGDDKIYRNAYSLLSDSLDTSAYRIAVRLQEDSRGGSIFMHEQVHEGDELNIKPPANMFAPYWGAKKHLLLAGGVGITPFMSYLPEMSRREKEVEVHYLYRGQQTGAYKDKLKETLGTKFYSYDSDLDERCDLENVLAAQPLGTHIYICGPASLTEATMDIATKMGIPHSVIHTEEFAAPKPGEPFTVEIKSSGKSVAVDSEESLLEALEKANVDVPSLCRGGVCGQCVCKVADGEVEHRDKFLSDEEKAEGSLIMPCVSRSRSERLVLDI
jgi:ferredoxin-NADP reductase